MYTNYIQLKSGHMKLEKERKNYNIPQNILTRFPPIMFISSKVAKNFSPDVSVYLTSVAKTRSVSFKTKRQFKVA